MLLYTGYPTLRKDAIYTPAVVLRPGQLTPPRAQCRWPTLPQPCCCCCSALPPGYKYSSKAY